MELPKDRSIQDLHAHFADLQQRYDQLRRAHDLLYALLDQSPAAVSLKEPGPQGRYVYLNAQWERAFGVAVAEALGKTDRDLWNPAIAEQLEKLDVPVLETGRPADGVISMNQPDGTHDWLSWRFPVRCPSGRNLLGGFSVERSSTVEPLEHRLVCKARPGLMGVVYGEEDRIVEANEVFLNMLGYTREDLAAGRVSLDAITAPISAHTCEEARREIDAHNSVSLKEVELLRKDGSVISAGIGGSVLDRTPRFAWVMYALDMAEQRRAERLLRREEVWERLGLMAAGLAHDFNNLLVVIIGNASMAASDLSASPKIRDYLQEVLSAAEQAAVLIRQMLVYSGKARITQARVPIGEIIRNLATQKVPPGVQLVLEVPEDLPPVSGDASQLGDALRNLLENALEAVGERGLVRVSAAACRIDQPIAYHDGEIPAGEYVCLTVEDTGPGIEEHLQTRLFDPFFTTKFHGRGLGLAAAYGIVRRHGGGIHIESAPGKGTRFEVLLKVAPH